MGRRTVLQWRHACNCSYDETGRRMGHEAMGVVDAVGADVRTMRVGDLVLIES
jgi:threonine dehydrogenase-like Zn-dependent dehydrogenase